MGVRLIVEALDYAPEDLTPRERYTLVVLAENARDTTRACWPGIEDDEVFIRRSRLASRSQRYAVIKALIEKGALERTQRGQKGVRAGYRISPLAPADASLPAPEESTVQGPGFRDNEDSQGPGNQDAENRDADVQGPGFEHSGSRFSTFRVPETRTPSPQSPQSPQASKPADPPATSSRVPESALPLVDLMTANGLNGIRWNLNPTDWFTVDALMKAKGAEAMTACAIRTAANARNGVSSAKYFIPGWKELPNQPAEGAANTQRLHLVDGRQPTRGGAFDPDIITPAQAQAGVQVII